MDQQQTSKAGVDIGRVRAAVEPVLRARGLSLDDVAWTSSPSGWTLRLTIERQGSSHIDGGVTLADCVDASRDVSAVLDADDLVPCHYNLEVTSPGLERPLRTEAEFARFTGKLARVKLSKPAPDGQRVLRGTIEACQGGCVRMRVDEKLIEVPYADVVEANLVFEFLPQPKKGGRPGKATPRSNPRK